MKIQPIQQSPTFQYNSPLKTLYRKGELPVRYGFYGDRLTQNNVSLEHLKPHSKGGKAELSNLVLASKQKKQARGNADIRNGYVFPRIWTTEITKIASKGDIILCVRAPAGDVGRTKFNVVIGRGVAAIKGNDFIFQQLQFMKSSGYWKKYISGSTFESINSNDIKNAKIFCPSQLEQKNISSLLDDIDTSIQIQQKNILDFKYIKQFLLQNMFI